MLDVLLLGGGASSLFLLAQIKKARPFLHVGLIEKEPFTGKKLLATGNGHANILNKDLAKDKYNHPDFIEPFIDKYPFKVLKKNFEELGIEVREENGLYYPLSYSAKNLVEILRLSLKGVEVYNFYVKAYKKIDGGYEVTDGKTNVKAKKLVIATGGKSGKNLGSDGSLFSVLKEHGYEIKPLKPALAPLPVKEKIQSLKGIRNKVNLKVFKDKQLIFEERGEVLFRDKELSGIVTFNACSAITWKHAFPCEVSLDLLPDISEEELSKMLSETKNVLKENYLSSFFVKPLGDYLLLENQKTKIRLQKLIKNLVFHVHNPIDFMSSQVTNGGVSLKEITSNLESKREPGVYFAGEVLDIDGYCGGFNLSWCWMSALTILEALLKSN